MTLSDLYENLCTLETTYGIRHGGSTVPWWSFERDAIEAILHELCHGVCLGGPQYCYDIEEHLPDGQIARVNQELRTLRVERRVFELLEQPLSRRKALRLFEAADFDGYAVEQERFEAPLTAREQKLAARVVRLIKAA